MGPRLFFLLRTALGDRPKGPPTTNHQQPPTANRQPPTAANRQRRPTTNRQPLPTTIHHQSPTTNRRQIPPTATNRHQPPTTSRQPPTANLPPPTHGVPAGIFGKPGYRNTFFSFVKDRPGGGWLAQLGGEEKFGGVQAHFFRGLAPTRRSGGEGGGGVGTGFGAGWGVWCYRGALGGGGGLTQRNTPLQSHMPRGHESSNIPRRWCTKAYGLCSDLYAMRAELQLALFVHCMWDAAWAMALFVGARRAIEPQQSLSNAPTSETCAATCTEMREDGRGRVIGPHAHRNVGRQVADDQDNTPEGWSNWASCTQKRSGECGGRPGGERAAETVNRLPQQPAQPQCANYSAPLTRKRHHKKHRPQRPSERIDPTRHAKGRTGDCPGPRKETATRRNVSRGGGGGGQEMHFR